MLLQCFPSSFGSIQFTVWKEMLVWRISRWHGSHLGYQNNDFSNSEPLCRSHQVSVQSDLWFRRCHLKIFKMATWRPSWILEQNNFSNSEFLCCFYAPTKFPLNLTYGFGGNVVWRISRYRNDFSNSESLCHLDASHQVLAQLDFQFGKRCHLKNFKMATLAAILDTGTEWFQQFWISTLPQCFHKVSRAMDY